MCSLDDAGFFRRFPRAPPRGSPPDVSHSLAGLLGSWRLWLRKYVNSWWKHHGFEITGLQVGGIRSREYETVHVEFRMQRLVCFGVFIACTWRASAKARAASALVWAPFESNATCCARVHKCFGGHFSFRGKKHQNATCRPPNETAEKAPSKVESKQNKKSARQERKPTGSGRPPITTTNALSCVGKGEFAAWRA